MPPPPVKRCEECSRVKKKCVMPPGKSQCELCAEKGILCQNYDWPAPRVRPPLPSSPRQDAPQTGQKTSIGGSDSRRDNGQDNTRPIYPRYESALNLGRGNMSEGGRLARPDPRYQTTLLYGAIGQQNATPIVYSGSSNTNPSFNQFIGNSMPQSPSWSNPQQSASYQMGQNPRGYPSEQQYHWSGQPKRYKPY